MRLLYGRVTAPAAVAAELAVGRSLGIDLPDLEGLKWIDIRRPQRGEFLAKVADLGAGEREALALGAEAPGSLVLLDDAFARRIADLLGIRRIGTLGVLLQAKQRGLLPVVRPVLDRLDGLRFRVGLETRRAVLRLAGESE